MTHQQSQSGGTNRAEPQERGAPAFPHPNHH